MKIFNPQEKILHHLNEVKDLLDSKNPDPITLEIDPSNTCNHSCPFCISGHIHLDKYKNSEFFNRAILSKEVFKKLIVDLCNTNVKSINWTGGGEPTQNPFLKDAIQYISNNSKIEMGMFTNGSLIERFNLFETILNCLSWIRISLDAGKPETYDDLRKTNKSNNFEVVMSNIKKLVELKKKNKSLITIGVGFVVTEANYEEIIDFSKLFEHIDVDYCQFKPEKVQIERLKEFQLSKNTLDKGLLQISPDFWLKKVVILLDQASALLGSKFQCNAYKIEDLILDKNNYGRNYKECLGSQLQPCISADGNVYVCTNHRGHKKYSYGNINDRNFSSIWKDLEKKKEVMNIINNAEKFSKCTHLCKPHESNKILYKLKQIYKEDKNLFQKLKEQTRNLANKISHINFI